MDHIASLLLGLGNGGVFAALALALVITYRASGVINFGTGAIALYVAYTYAGLRRGELLVPFPGLPKTIDLGQELGFAAAVAVSLVVAAALGALLYVLVFRPLRDASQLAKAVASLGVLVVIQGTLAIRFQDLDPESEDLPRIIDQRVMTHDELRDFLPAGDFITAQQRAELLELRKAGYNNRWAPFPQP